MQSLDKIVFVLSVALFAFVYGIATQAFDLFPSDLAQRAWNQAERYFPGRPEYTEPRVYDSSGVRVFNPEAVHPGLTMITSAWKAPAGWEPQLRLINSKGDVVHKWRLDPERYFSPEDNRGDATLDNAIANKFVLLPNGDVLANFNYVGTVRLDACGQVVWSLPEGSHHTIERGHEGSFWIPAIAKDDSDATSDYIHSYVGLGTPSHQNIVLRVTGDGEIVDMISVLDVLYQNDLESYIAKAHGHSKSQDVTHINDVEPLDDSIANSYPLLDGGDLVVSSRQLDLVFVFDPDTKVVKWHASDPFIHQHDPDFIGDGWIGIFDNREEFTRRGNMLGGSRIVAIQPGGDSIRVLFPTPQSEPFYTNVSGEWQSLPNGNRLLVEQMAGRIVEVDSSGRTVWEWINEPYDGTFVAEVPHAKRYNLTENEVRAWSCEESNFTTGEEETSQ